MLPQPLHVTSDVSARVCVQEGASERWIREAQTHTHAQKQCSRSQITDTETTPNQTDRTSLGSDCLADKSRLLGNARKDRAGTGRAREGDQPRRHHRARREQNVEDFPLRILRRLGRKTKKGGKQGGGIKLNEQKDSHPSRPWFKSVVVVLPYFFLLFRLLHQTPNQQASLPSDLRGGVPRRIGRRTGRSGRETGDRPGRRHEAPEPGPPARSARPPAVMTAR